MNGTNCVVGLSEYCWITFSSAIIYISGKNADNDYVVEIQYEEIGGDVLECINHVVVPKQFPVYSLPNDLVIWKSLAWAGRVEDPPRLWWVNYMRENENPNFVDEDLDEGPQPIYIWDPFGDDEWDGRFGEMYNNDEGVVGAGGIYGYSDDEEFSRNDSIFLYPGVQGGWVSQGVAEEEGQSCS